MWIVPKTLSAFVPDTEESSLDFDSLASILEQSAMWRSKPSLKRTWLQRLNKVKWMQLLSGRILKPSQHKAFLEKYTASLAVIPVSHSATQDSEKEPTTLDTFGRILSNTSVQLDLFGASLKTSEDTSRLDSMRSLQAFAIWVTKLRQDCLQRQKLVQAINEKGSLSWPTPDVMNKQESAETAKKRMEKHKEDDRPTGGTRNLYQVVMGAWTTPSVSTGGYTQKNALMIPKLDQQIKQWPTPTQAEADKIGNNANYGQIALGNHPAIRGEVNRLKKNKGDGRRALGPNNTNGKNRGQLNPAWVEQLMGLPAGWTNFDSWVTELSPKQQN